MQTHDVLQCVLVHRAVNLFVACSFRLMFIDAIIFVVIGTFHIVFRVTIDKIITKCTTGCVRRVQ